MEGVSSNPLSHYLRQKRKAQSMTLEETARNAGIGRVTLNRWERGTHLPRLPELEQVLTALGVRGRERMRTLTMLDAPRAQVRLQEEVKEIARLRDLPPIPHGGEFLQAMRLRHGASRETVAQAVGVTTRTIRLWEQGEIWPNTEKLHRFCYALSADSSELIALTCGRFDVQPAERHTSIEALRHRLKQLELQPLLPGSQSLRDLEYLQLETQGWKLAARQDAGKKMLAEIYSSHARSISLSFQDVFAGEYALRALDLMPLTATLPQDRFWHNARVLYAISLWKQGGRSKAVQSYEMLNQWLPLTHDPLYASWMRSRMASILMELENKEEALQQAKIACHVAEGCERPMDLRLRRLERAEVLIEVGQAENALGHLVLYADDDPIRKVAIGLARARAYLDMDDQNTAHQELQRVIPLCHQYQLALPLQDVEQLSHRL